MAQFDVYLNPSAASRKETPYVVDIQSKVLEIVPSRLCVPLAFIKDPARLPTNLLPHFMIGQDAVFMRPHLAAPLPARILTKPLTSLAASQHQIIAAMDAVMSGY